MSERDAYVEKMKAKLDEWNADIEKLEALSHQVKADTRLKYEQELQALKTRRDDARLRLHELQNASTDAWQTMRVGLDEAWLSISSAFLEAIKRFK